MTLREICRAIECEVITGEDMLDHDFKEVCGADLMSDVLAFAAPGGILLTGLRNVQSVITSHVAEVQAIVYVRGKKPDEDAVKLAVQKGIPLLSCPLSMFEACGRLYEKGMKSGNQIGGK
ncbi:MAG: DRTGG domain-containing protein [Candidatus Eisenbacteria bacterium]